MKSFPAHPPHGSQFSGSVQSVYGSGLLNTGFRLPRFSGSAPPTPVRNFTVAVVVAPFFVYCRTLNNRILLLISAGLGVQVHTCV